MNRASLFVTLAIAAMRCSSPPSSPADAGGACLSGTAPPPHATLCEPTPGAEPCCAPAHCAAVPGGFACTLE